MSDFDFMKAEYIAVGVMIGMNVCIERQSRAMHNIFMDLVDCNIV